MDEREELDALARPEEVPHDRRPHGRRILHVARRVLVERAAQHVQRHRRHGVAVQGERMRHRRPRRADLGGIQRPFAVAPVGQLVVRHVQRVAQHRLVHDVVVAGIANVALHGHRVAGGAFQREPRLEQRAVQIVHPPPRRVAMQFARPQDQLARQRRVGQLHGAHRPHQRFPIAHRHAGPVPRHPRAQSGSSGRRRARAPRHRNTRIAGCG